MHHKVLYRKYRPNNFSEIVGQDYIINILKKSVANDKIGHAYLFCGPRGTGKTSAARVFAKAVNCLELNTGEPCDKCNNCLNINSSDIIEIDAASNNGVDEIRELRNNVKIMPSVLSYKIYIVDEVHMLSAGAFNALLKTLEEPPQHVIFILATTDPQKIPLTVLSRCQRFDFKKIPAATLTNHLKKIAKAEKIKITDEALEEIAFLGDGAARDALSYLEQITSAYDDKITLEDIEETYKTVSTKIVEELIESLNNGDYKSLNTIIKNLENDGIDFSSFINKFIIALRKFSLSDKALNNVKRIKNLIFELNDLLIKTISGVNPYLLLEVVLGDYISENIVVVNKEKTEEKIVKEDTVVEEVKEIKKSKPIQPVVNDYINDLVKVRVHNCFVKANKELLAYDRKLWKEFLEKSIDNKKLLGYIIDTTIVLGSDEYLIIEANNKSQTGLINENLNNIEEEFNSIIGVKFKMSALTSKEWNDNKKKFIEDKKNKIDYEIEEEPKQVIVAEKIKQDVVYEIFDKNRIEIE